MVGDQRHAALTTGKREPRTRIYDRLAGDGESEPADARRRRLRHDIRHELATIRLLGSLLSTADDIGGISRQWATQLLHETHWLAELLDAHEDTPIESMTMSWSPTTERLRIDTLAGEVVAALRLTHLTTVHFAPVEVWACAHRLDLWRALRNVLENAFQAAGPQGQVRVRVVVEGATAVVEVDDDGPGFRAGPQSMASLGLTIVREILTEHGGSLAISASDLGGGHVRLRLPAIPPPSPTDQWIREGGGAGTDL